MKGSKAEPTGSLTILLQYDEYQVQGAHLSIPLLGIEEHITQFTQFDSLLAGNYSGVITAYMMNGKEIDRPVKIRVLPNQGNLHEFRIEGPPQEVIIRPADAENRTILFSEIKVENVDFNFRPVRDERGVLCKIHPGEYQVQVILPNLSIKTLPLKISRDNQIYTLTIADRHANSRNDNRIELKVPVEYRTHDGKWVSTQTINISSTGICVIKRQWTVDDEQIGVRLYVPFSSKPIECEAAVRWVREEGSAHSRMGIELKLEPPLKAALSRWIAENVARKPSKGKSGK